ncbi:MAG: NAD(P)H-hydrate dehydratase [Thermomicrobiales bacterium]|nr:NAD(P)H-hydrate dehydratase [Thermomicrobiales bacterium]
MPTIDAARRPELGPKDATIDRALALALLPRRAFGAHKWGVGGLVIVAGAPGFAGAAALSAAAAGRAGAGIVHVAAPRSIASVVVMRSPEVVTVPLAEGETAFAGRRSLEGLEAKLEKSAALLVGPGLGEDEAAGALLGALFGAGPTRTRIGFGFGAAPDVEIPASEGVIGRAGKPVAIDADALNWLAKQPSWPDLLPKGNAVLTPHVGEMSRLLDRPTDEILADPVGTTREAARAWGTVVLFKYGYTAISDGERTLVAEDAPTSLATAGTGDVLAGAVGAFLAQGLMPLDAAALAVYTGMQAARRVERRVGTLGLVASDLPLAIAEELAALEIERGDGDA